MCHVRGAMCHVRCDVWGTMGLARMEDAGAGGSAQPPTAGPVRCIRAIHAYTRSPVSKRAITSRWISLVPS